MQKQQSASQTVGPYFRIGLIYGEAQNNLVQEKTAGERIHIIGTVFDGEGQPVNDAMIEIWQPDANGIFNHEADPLHEQADPHFFGFGRAENRDGGVYEFWTVKPAGRDNHAPFINVYIFARGMLRHALTRLYFADETANESDPVLAALPADQRSTLIASQIDAGDLPTYRFDIHLQGDKETVFFES